LELIERIHVIDTKPLQSRPAVSSAVASAKGH
jgi:hypothetical protein